MKKFGVIVLAISIFTFTELSSQMFNSARYLGKGNFFAGVEPGVFAKGNADPFVFFHGGFGLLNGVDLSLHAGFSNATYLGADLEWILAKRLTLTTGAHNFGDFGLNGALTYYVPITRGTNFWFGGDMDINFGNEISVPVWVPLGVEIAWQENMAFLFESEIGLTSPATHVIGLGVVFYIN